MSCELQDDFTAEIMTSKTPMTSLLGQITGRVATVAANFKFLTARQCFCLPLLKFI